MTSRAAQGEKRRTTEHRALRQRRVRGIQRRRMERRLVFLSCVFLLAFGVVGLRLVDLMLFNGGALVQVAGPAPEPATGRADIVDRHGQIIATDLVTSSLYADARKVIDPEEAAIALSRILDLDAARLKERLSSGRAFVWVARHLTPPQRYAVHSLGLPGLYFRADAERLYPAGRLAAHAVGYTDIDGNGLAGVERAFDERLREKGRNGAALKLSIDLRVQGLLTEELAAAMARFDALGAAGILMDARSGEVLAMVSLPDFHPQDPGEAPADARFNRVTMGVYEQGSTFKTFSLAAALEAGTVGLESVVDASRPISIGGFTIRDYRGEYRELSVPEIFVHSSNIGTALIARELGGDQLRMFYERLGLTATPPLEIGERAAPLLPPRWSEIATMTASYGHGISVSMLSVARAAAVVVNGGRQVTPTLLRLNADDRRVARAGEQVLSAETSAMMRALLRLNVVEGTGRSADTEIFPVGGKTGTADKPVAGSYDTDAIISSFLGVFPAHDPDYVIVVALDEPKGIPETHGFATAGWTAAPVVGNVVARAGPVLAFGPEGAGARAALSDLDGPRESRSRRGHNVLFSSLSN